MLLLLIFWFLALFALYKYSMVRGGRAFDWTNLVVSDSDSVAISIFQKVAGFKYLTRPGWFIKKVTDPSKIQRRIDESGMMLTTKEYQQFKQFVWSVSFIIFWIYILLADVTWGMSIYLLGIGLFLFFFIDMWLVIQKEKQVEKFENEIPYFIDMVALTLESGLNIEQTLHSVTQSKKNMMARVIQKDLLGLGMGKTPEAVLAGLRTKIPVSAFGNFVTSVLQAKQLGVSLAETLKIQSELIRTQRRQRAEEMGRTAAVKISIPLVLFIFPALVIIYVGPGILQLMRAGI